MCLYVPHQKSNNSLNKYLLVRTDFTCKLYADLALSFERIAEINSLSEQFSSARWFLGGKKAKYFRT